MGWGDDGSEEVETHETRGKHKYERGGVYRIEMRVKEKRGWKRSEERRGEEMRQETERG